MCFNRRKIRSDEIYSRDRLQPRAGPWFGEESSRSAKTTRQYLRDLSQRQKGTGKIGIGNVQPARTICHISYYNFLISGYSCLPIGAISTLCHYDGMNFSRILITCVDRCHQSTNILSLPTTLPFTNPTRMMLESH
jgi:hypothetical protein